MILMSLRVLTYLAGWLGGSVAGLLNSRILMILIVLMILMILRVLTYLAGWLVGQPGQLFKIFN